MFPRRAEKFKTTSKKFVEIKKERKKKEKGKEEVLEDIISSMKSLSRKQKRAKETTKVDEEEDDSDVEEIVINCFRGLRPAEDENAAAKPKKCSDPPLPPRVKRLRDRRNAVALPGDDFIANACLESTEGRTVLGFRDKMRSLGSEVALEVLLHGLVHPRGYRRILEAADRLAKDRNGRRAEKENELEEA